MEASSLREMNRKKEHQNGINYDRNNGNNGNNGYNGNNGNNGNNKNGNITPKVYNIPNDCPQNNRNNYDINNSSVLADRSWREISNELSSGHSSAQHLHSPQGGVLGGHSGGHLGGGTGGSYRGVGSPSGMNSIGASGSWDSYRSPFSLGGDRTSRSFLTYNVSPIMESNTAGQRDNDRDDCDDCDNNDGDDNNDGNI